MALKSTTKLAAQKITIAAPSAKEPEKSLPKVALKKTAKAARVQKVKSPSKKTVQPVRRSSTCTRAASEEPVLHSGRSPA